MNLLTTTAVAEYSSLAAMVMAVALAPPVALMAQDAPRASVLAGFGNAFGWIGAQVEGYVAEGRVSAFAGLGYMPNLLNDEGSGIAGAVGVRAFTGGSRHRGLLEISLTALSNTVSSTFGGDVLEKDRHYGPGIAVGYQFVGDGGFTAMLSGGVGVDDEGLDPENSRLQPTIGIGVGLSVR